jgi:hypothetical protein
VKSDMHPVSFRYTILEAAFLGSSPFTDAVTWVLELSLVPPKPSSRFSGQNCGCWVLTPAVS